MRLKSLTTAQMIAIADALLDPGDESLALLQSSPQTIAAIPSIRAARDALAGLRKPDAVARQRLTAQARQLDARHDELVRGASALLLGLGRLATEQSERERAERLHAVLFPTRANPTEKSYMAEAGYAEALDSRVTPQVRSELAAIPVGSRTMLDVVTEWIDTARRLREVEGVRSRLAIDTRSSGDGKPASVTARNRWTRAINAMLVMLELSELPEASKAKVVAQLQRHAQGSKSRRRADAE